MRALLEQLQTLKSSYAQEVSRLRERDVQVQALQARLAGRASPTMSPAVRVEVPPQAVAAASAQAPAAG